MWKFKRSVGRFPVPRFWSPEDMKIVGWCLSNNISISCTVDWKNNIDKWFIDIKINNKIYRDPNTYKDETVSNKIYEYYKYYYDKHRN